MEINSVERIGQIRASSASLAVRAGSRDGLTELFDRLDSLHLFQQIGQFIEETGKPGWIRVSV